MTTPVCHIDFRRIFCLVAAFFFVQLGFIGLPQLWGSSEAREAHVVWTILTTGEWILPLRNGIIPSKPLCFHWIAAILSWGWGSVSLFTVRLVSLLASAGVLLITLRSTAILSWHAGPTRQSNSVGFAWFIMSTSYLFFANAGDAKVDMLFAFWITAAVSSHVLRVVSKYGAFEAPNACSEKSAGFWLYCAAAALTKGPLGFVLPVILALAATACLTSIRTGFRELASSWPFAVLGVFVVAIWYTAAYIEGGNPFLERHLFFENLQRIAGGRNMNVEAWWFYGASLLRTAFPWSLLAFGLGMTVVVDRAGNPIRRIGFAVLVVGIIFFSIASGKRHSYLLPLVPWMSVAIALNADRIRISHRMAYAGRTFLIGVVLILTMLLGILLASPLLIRLLSYSPQSLVAVHVLEQFRVNVQWIMFAAILFFCGLKWIYHRRIYPRPEYWVALFLGACIFYGGLCVKGELRSFQRNAVLIANTVGAAPLTVLKGPYDEYFDPLFFYLYRQVSISETRANCSGFYLVKLEELEERGGRADEIVRRIGEVPKRFGDRLKRELVLGMCSSQSG